MRGEKAAAAAFSGWSLGSPPHARGKAIATAYKEIAERITPACAGKSKSLQFQSQGS